MIFKPGINCNGYFTSENLLQQVEHAIDIVEGKTKGNSQGLFLFDNAPSHQKRCYTFLSPCPTTCRYIGLPSFPSPPSYHKGLCTFTIQSYCYDHILPPHALYDIYLMLQFDLANSYVQYTSQSHSYDY